MNARLSAHHAVPRCLLILLALQITGCNLPLTPGAPAGDAGASAFPSSTAEPENTDTPPPTPVPAWLVWYAPNMGSTDYTELFTKPENWSVAREQVDVFKFYTQNVYPDPCDICGDNTLQAFVEADAFRKLNDWGLAIALEVGAVKPWGCTSYITFDAARNAIQNVERNGGVVSFLALDEPRVGGEESPGGLTCAYGMQESAFQTAAFIQRVRAAYPDMVVGDIQAYPHFSADEIQEWELELQRLGAEPDFLHMDVDIERVRAEGANVKADLQALRQFCQQRGIRFGVILTSNWRAAGSNRAYYDSTMGWIETVNEAIGRPQHVIFQSWQGPAPSGDHEVPINLPQNDPENYSHVRLINFGLELFEP